MFRLQEDLAKAWLREMGCPIPRGAAASTSRAAARIAEELATASMVKALVPAGRRGKAGGIRVARDACEAASAACELLGATVDRHAVREVLVEQKIEIARELFLSFAVTGRGLEMMLCASGGVDIEETAATNPAAVIRAAISPIRGAGSSLAAEHWRRAGIHGDILTPLAQLTARLYDAFVRADGLLLELNPIVETRDGALCIVGAMLGIDDHALFRHPQWVRESGDATLPENERERRVALVDRSIPGGECRYVELDGDIGLLVGGGGAGLYQHDRVLAMGGRPANHAVAPPTGNDSRKLRAVIDAILDHPGLRGLLVGFNFSQMSRVDLRVRTLVEALAEKRIDTRALPVVLRLFGAGEAESRALVAGLHNVHYLPRGASLDDGVRLIVELAAARGRSEPA